MKVRTNRRVRVILTLLTAVFLYGSVGAYTADDHVSNRPESSIVHTNKGHMNVNSTIRDVVNHPYVRGP